MAFLNELVEKLKVFEGFRSRPYICPTGRIVTIGYGHTGKVKAHAKLTRDGAHSLLVDDLKAIDLQLQSAGINLPIYKQSAVIELVFHIGFTAFKKSRLYNYIIHYDPLYDDIIKELFKLFIYYHDKNGNKIKSHSFLERRLYDVKLFSHK